MSSNIHITNLRDKKQSIQILVSSVQDRIKQAKTAVIQIDLSFPQAYPITTNPETLCYIIEELLELGLEEITLIGNSYYDLSAEKIWKSLGYQEFISNRFPHVQFIPIEDDSCIKSIVEVNSRKIEFPTIIIQSELFISLVNPKASIFSQLSLAINQNRELLRYKDKRIPTNKEDPTYCDKNLYLQSYMEELIQIHLIRRPDLVFYDLSTVVSKAGPILYSDSQFQYSDLFMISDNSILGDYVALLLCNKVPDDNPVIEALKNHDYSLISQSVMDDCSIIISDLNDTGEIRQQKEAHFFAFSEEEKKKRFSFWKKKEIEKEKEITIAKIDEFKPFIDILDIFPQKFEICKGTECSGCKNAVIELLLLLKTAMQKDQETLPRISLLFGNNPVEPKNEFCLVFGDHAIDSTRERKFREKRVTRTMRSEQDLDLERAKLKIKLQKKIVELESHHDVIKQEITKGPKLERTTKRLEQKIARMKKFHEYRINVHEKYLMQRQKQDTKLLEKEKTRKNPHVLEIPGCPPDPISCLPEIIKFLGKRWTPGLVLRTQFLQSFLPNHLNHDSIHNKNSEETEIRP